MSQAAPHRLSTQQSALLSGIPAAQGLYDPRAEKDACGVAFVATLTGAAGHGIVEQALTALRNLEHRGASGAEVDSGDGAGILVQVPDAFLREIVDFELPPAGSYAVGLAFIPNSDEVELQVYDTVAAIAAEEGLEVLGWRYVPTTPELLGATARAVMPRFRQLFVAGANGESGIGRDRLAFVPRKPAEAGHAV